MVETGYIDIEKYLARNIVSELRGICRICGHNNSFIMKPKCEHYVYYDLEDE